MHTLLIAVVCAALNLACVPKPPPIPVPPQPPIGEPTCADACQRLDQLGCDAAKPTPRGHSCLEVCRNVQESGIVTWDLRCLVSATSCTVADRCQ